MLGIAADRPVAARPLVEAFAERCRLSKEYQGDGWGVAWRQGGAWHAHHALEPIWDARVPDLPASTLVLVHARSAFRNEGIAVENNMPFVDHGVAFAFNGELRGVRLQAPGDTGAWRLFHLFRRFRAAAGGDGAAALRRLDAVVAARTGYVRALNVVVADGRRIHVNARHSEDPDYFTLWRATLGGSEARLSLVSSERFTLPRGAGAGWEPVGTGAVVTLEEAAPCWS